MKILITGVLGYIGTELVNNLNCFNNEVIGIDKDFIPDKVAHLVSHGVKFYQRDLFNIKELLSDIDVCFHLAAVTKVPITEEESTPEIDAEINKIGIDGTKYILDNLPDNCKVIFTSTHVVWNGLQESIFNINENYPVCPLLAYPKSKYQNELDIKSSGKNFVIFRLGTVYGYNNSVRFSVGNLFAKMSSQGQTIKAFGGGVNYKSLIGVTDVARALILASQSDHLDKNTYILSNDNVTVMQIADICKKYNSDTKIISTNDKVINKGYTTCSKKILDTGFVFCQNLETEISLMIKLWKNKK